MLFKKDGRKKTLTPIQEKILNYIKYQKIDPQSNGYYFDLQ